MNKSFGIFVKEEFQPIQEMLFGGNYLYHKQLLTLIQQNYSEAKYFAFFDEHIRTLYYEVYGKNKNGDDIALNYLEILSRSIIIDNTTGIRAFQTIACMYPPDAADYFWKLFFSKLYDKALYNCLHQTMHDLALQGNNQNHLPHILYLVTRFIYQGFSKIDYYKLIDPNPSDFLSSLFDMIKSFSRCNHPLCFKSFQYTAFSFSTFLSSRHVQKWSQREIVLTMYEDECTQLLISTLRNNGNILCLTDLIDLTDKLSSNYIAPSKLTMDIFLGLVDIANSWQSPPKYDDDKKLRWSIMNKIAEMFNKYFPVWKINLGSWISPVFVFASRFRFNEKIRPLLMEFLDHPIYHDFIYKGDMERLYEGSRDLGEEEIFYKVSEILKTTKEDDEIEPGNEIINLDYSRIVEVFQSAIDVVKNQNQLVIDELIDQNIKLTTQLNQVQESNSINMDMSEVDLSEEIWFI